MDVLAAIRHNVTQHRMLQAGNTVVVAVSGGPDSTCLLHALTCLRSELSIDLHVAHLNHGLRGDEAAADALYVANLASEWGIPRTIETADIQAYRRTRHLSLEEAARQVRYKFLQRVAATCGAAAIAVGHTADDQVETIIMHLLRGAGLTGLRGMLPVQSWPGGVPLIRPLLDVRRRDIEDYCTANGLQPHRDCSNDDERIWRNRLRRRVLPLLEQISPAMPTTILRTARILAEEDAYLNDQTKSIWTKAVTVGDDVVRVDLSIWQALPLVLQRRLLRAVWQQAAQTYDDLSWAHVEHARAVIAGPTGSTLSLPHGWRLYRGYTSFSLTRRVDGEEAQPDLPLLSVDTLELVVPGITMLPQSRWYVETVILPGTPSTASRLPLTEDFDVDTTGERLCLRRRRTGDRMLPLGMTGSKKVHDIMIDEHLPRPWRDRVPLLVTADDRILWVVGARRSDWGKVQPGTRRIVRLAFRHQTDGR